MSFNPKGQALSASTQRAILRRHKKGLTIYRIAQDLGISQAGVRNALVRAGAYTPRKPFKLKAKRNERIKVLIEQGQTQAQTARQFGITRQRVRQIVHGV